MMLGIVIATAFLSAAAATFVYAMLSANARAEDHERMARMMADLYGSCNACKHYDVWNFLKGDGMCYGCKHRPGGIGIDDCWEWRRGE